MNPYKFILTLFNNWLEICFVEKSFVLILEEKHLLFKNSDNKKETTVPNFYLWLIAHDRFLQIK